TTFHRPKRIRADSLDLRTGPSIRAAPARIGDLAPLAALRPTHQPITPGAARCAGDLDKARAAPPGSCRPKPKRARPRSGRAPPRSPASIRRLRPEAGRGRVV